ncbi:MAG: hypothetical protein DRN47_04325 [Candidatus Wolframiiraptor sp.]|nr:MAG: hypothetical protein DRN47_04325 [Candidatus Wolframiiraptor sp.]
MVTREEVLSRFFKIGSGAAAIGAIHILALLLSWYTEANSGAAIYGYVFPEALILSITGGLLAGIGMIAAYFAKRLRLLKLFLGGFTVIGGVLATLSPIYIYAIKLLGLSVNVHLDIGFFAAVFTGVLQLGVGSLALLTPVKEETVPTPPPVVTPPVRPGPPPTAEAARPSRAVTAKIVPAPDLEEAVCSICFEPIPVGEAVRCSNCDAVFHKGCVDTWVSVNGTCPSCKAIIVD